MQIDHEGGVHTAIGDPEVGVPKTFCLVYGYTQKGLRVRITSPWSSVLKRVFLFMCSVRPTEALTFKMYIWTDLIEHASAAYR